MPPQTRAHQLHQLALTKTATLWASSRGVFHFEDQGSVKPRQRAVRHTRGAFTLLETLIVVSLITLLLSILLPVLGAVRGQMKTLKCSSNLRTTVFKFQLFAENENPEGRGDSSQLVRRNFFINDFMDSAYRIDEFWDAGTLPTAALRSEKDAMLCPAGAAQLTKRRGFPCGSAALGPAEDVSLAANMRLYRGTVEFMGDSVLAPVAATHVRQDVLSHPYVPLILDVDGREAVARGLEPFYTAPPLRGADGAYASGRYWMPSKRHGGRTNVAFVGGHVLSSVRPESESWDWKYPAEVGN